jgi:hypothetical protein
MRHLDQIRFQGRPKVPVSEIGLAFEIQRCLCLGPAESTCCQHTQELRDFTCDLRQT